jgi:hypothetical protein
MLMAFRVSAAGAMDIMKSYVIAKNASRKNLNGHAWQWALMWLKSWECYGRSSIMDAAIDEFTINLAITIIVMVCALALVGGKDDER